VAIVLVDDDGSFRDVNAAASGFLGRSSKQLRGEQIGAFVPAERAAGFRAFWHRLMDGEAQEPKFVLVDANGRPQEVALQGKANYMPGFHLLSFSQAGAREPAQPTRASLTPREREIFQLLALGFSGREIADRLVLSPDTVRTHVQNGIGRLGAKTRAQGIAIALTRGDISL
jgi:DNA-binding CsgD family transcriptional regulator